MKPPYRADQVGSLLRPALLAETRSQFRKGRVGAAELRRVEDDCIHAVVAR